MRTIVLTAAVLLAIAPSAFPDTSPKRKPSRVVLFLDAARTIRMEFVRIRAGAFTMGEGGFAHEVRITRDYWMQTTEVTQAQWEVSGMENRSESRGEANPVDNVSWDDAQEFIAKLNERRTGRKASLPTEAEWEYGCRAGSKGTWCFGDDESQLQNYAWYGQLGGGTSQPVAQKKPNAWGLYDMHGNVLEWCQDGFGALTQDKAVDPVGPDSGGGRVIRGGGWWGTADLTGSARRHSYAQGFRGRMDGFRVILR